MKNNKQLKQSEVLDELDIVQNKANKLFRLAYITIFVLFVLLFISTNYELFYIWSFLVAILLALFTHKYTKLIKELNIISRKATRDYIEAKEKHEILKKQLNN
jgi:hypothetical protein